MAKSCLGVSRMNASHAPGFAARQRGLSIAALDPVAKAGGSFPNFSNLTRQKMYLQSPACPRGPYRVSFESRTSR
ncbi:hypothetical protein BGLA2_1110049 [Burkholderia gladioli]|nr:hypothetical protein BGLA2_1110049 [Burkholderia gladioli]